jgi:hypothetical protein
LKTYFALKACLVLKTCFALRTRAAPSPRPGGSLRFSPSVTRIQASQERDGAI